MEQLQQQAHRNYVPQTPPLFAWDAMLESPQAPMTPSRVPIPTSPQAAAADTSTLVITAKKSIGTGWHRGLLREQLVTYARSLGLKKPGKALSNCTRDEVCRLIEQQGQYPKTQGLDEYMEKFGH